MSHRPSEAACAGEEVIRCGWKQLLPGMRSEITAGSDYMDLSETPGKPTGGGERQAGAYMWAYYEKDGYRQH